LGTLFFYAVIAGVDFMQGDYASLDFLFLFDQCKKKEPHGGGQPWQGDVLGCFERDPACRRQVWQACAKGKNNYLPPISTSTNLN